VALHLENSLSKAKFRQMLGARRWHLSTAGKAALNLETAWRKAFAQKQVRTEQEDGCLVEVLLSALEYQGVRLKARTRSIKGFWCLDGCIAVLEGR